VIPVPKAGDFSVGLVTVKVKAKPGKKIPANLKLKLKLASKVPTQVAVAGSVRKKNRSTFKVAVVVVNKRTAKPPARAVSAAAVETAIVDVTSTAVGTNISLELTDTIPGPRNYLDNILTRPQSQQASWDPIWKGAQQDVEAAGTVNVYLDKGLAEEDIPEDFLQAILAIALEMSEDGEPDKGQALDILGEVNEFYVQAGDFGCVVTVQRNQFVPQVVDIFVKQCQAPIVEIAIVLPDYPAGLAYGPVVTFTPQGQRTDLQCRMIVDEAVYGIECSVPTFNAGYDLAGGFFNAPAGTNFAIAVCQSSDDIAVFNQRVP
jgi:hypothetical protein